MGVSFHSRAERGNYSVEFKTINGFLWPASDQECHPVVPNQLKDVDEALKYVKDFRRCIQAGGNVGVWPKYLAKHFGEVVTFEPDKENFECLVQNVTESNVFKYYGALGNENGTTGLRREPRNVGAHQTEGQGKIPVVKIDSLQGPVGFIQLDIEGDELAALEGAKETLLRDHPVLMLEDKELKNPKGMLEAFLVDYGYRVVKQVHRDIILA